jgi:hypothetical protein
MSHLDDKNYTRHNDFLVLFFCDGRRNESVTHLALSFSLLPFVTPFFSLAFFSFLTFLSIHMPFFSKSAAPTESPRWRQ